MTNIKTILNINIILLAVIISACKDEITPPTPPPPPPDSTSHEIIWEADTLGDFNSCLEAVWGSSPNDVWAAGWIFRGNGGTNLVHYDGENWEDYDYFEAEFWGMFGLDSSEIWAVGNNLCYPCNYALVAHYNGAEWKTVYVGENVPSLSAVWASAPNDVFAVGGKGTILHYNGNSWNIMEAGTKRNLYDIWGFGPDDVYACGGYTGAIGDTSKPILLHYDGNNWTSLLDTVNYPYRNINTVWGSSPDNVFFEGPYIEIGLYQGNLHDGWHFVPIPDDNTHITKIRGNKNYNIFLVGHYGLVVHYNGRNWRMYDELLEKPGGPILSDVMVFDNTVFIVGVEFGSLKGIVYRGIIQN